MTNTTQEAIILAVSIPILILCVVGLFKTNFLRKLHTRSWPPANGVVISTNVRRLAGKLYEPNVVSEIAYSYQVDGQYYSGYYRHRFYKERNALAFIDREKNQ